LSGKGKTQVAREWNECKPLKSGQKAKALNALKRRKVQEQLVTRIDGWQMQIEELLGSIEVRQRRLTLSKPGLKAKLVSALETKLR
jgi:hypothetical protein